MESTIWLVTNPANEASAGQPRASLPGRSALSALPSARARLVAFMAIIIGGLCGGLIGYGFMSLESDDDTLAAVVALVAAVAFAAGTAVIAVLALRAMGEWRQLADESDV